MGDIFAMVSGCSVRCCWLHVWTFKKTGKKSLTSDELISDQLGFLGAPAYPSHNPFYNEALQKEENEKVTGITYERGERLLPKDLYKALVDILPNNCAPAARCMLTEYS